MCEAGSNKTSEGKGKAVEKERKKVVVMEKQGCGESKSGGEKEMVVERKVGTV